MTASEYSASRGGLASNVGMRQLSDAERKEHEVFEENVEATEEVFRDATGFLGVGHGLPSMVGKNQLPTTAELIEKHVRRGEPVEAVMWDDKEDRWVLGDEYKVAWAAGYICQHCLGWQEIAHHTVCNTIHGGSCGMGNPFAPELTGVARHNLNA